MFTNGKKMEILREVIKSLEEATCFSAIDYMKGNGFEDYDINCFFDPNLYSFELAIEIIEEFEANSDQIPKEFLIGEGYSEEEIEYLLSTKAMD